MLAWVVLERLSEETDACCHGSRPQQQIQLRAACLQHATAHTAHILLGRACLFLADWHL